MVPFRPDHESFWRHPSRHGRISLEFIRIAESHGYHDIILSMKASNPKVMIQAYRLVVA